MASSSGSRRRLAGAFLHGARRYWIAVFPRLRLELRGWRRRAGGVPDASLRAVALSVQESKLGNIEGAAAFAAFTPPRHCRAVVRAQVAFQAIYDCVDSLSEQPHRDPIRNGRQLHAALSDSVRTVAQPPRDYYSRHSRRHDAGYLAALVTACGSSFAQLPSRRAVQRETIRFADRIVSYQSLNLGDFQGGLAHLAAWAAAQTPLWTDLRWWETAASAGSSLGVFALLAIAGEREVHASEAEAVAEAYFPWIGSLHSLLDSLIDEEEDRAEGQPNLVIHYTCHEQAVQRIREIAIEASRRAAALPRAARHTVILSGMVSFYLSAEQAGSPRAALVAGAVLSAVGGLAQAAMLVFRMRRLIGKSL